MIRRLVMTVAAAAVTTSLAPAAGPSAEAVFATVVLPVLKARCLACHGDDPDKLKGGLDLRTRAATLTGGDAGEAGLVPGNAAASVLYKAIVRTDADIPAMPPKENDKLTPAEITACATWIDGGAPWPSAERVAELVKATKPAGVTVKTSGGLSDDWTNRAYDPANLWAYQPLTRPDVPGNAGNAVDAFIDARLTAIGLTPAPAADRRTLIRRATLDLTGLPPTPAEVDAFLADPAADGPAFETVVDRLMASPHYGERMAQNWLDVTRYADSAGFANDFDRGNAWRYRDYVVRAFNTDKPYDEFVREQIAGDEIDPADPEKLVAVGFLRMGPWELTSMEVAKVARQRFLDDVTDSVGQVFLAHMLQCARCHDHKFDPVPTRDYYRIQAAFATTQPSERPAPFGDAENTDGFAEKKYLDARKARFQADLNRVRHAEEAGKQKWEADHPGQTAPKSAKQEYITPAEFGLERVSRKGLQRLAWEYDRYRPVALSVYSGHTPDLKAITTPFRPPENRTKGELEVAHILPGGDPFSPTAEVSPGTLSAAGELAIPAGVVGRRKALADWVTGERNPLTARVMANRVWQWAMGTPLAGNPNNFGATGKKPTHPKLLDFLAAEFVADGWSVKRLHRRIMLSDTYRRSARHPDPDGVAARDPDGTSYAVFTPRRLTAEEIRDAMLAASGELNLAVGGIPVRPEIHPDVAFQPRQVMGTFAAAWEPSPLPEQRHRRTLYALKLRGVRDPALEAFNAPSPDLSCERRDVSTVTPQAFTLFNGVGVRDRALALANRAVKETDSREVAISRAFRLAYGRGPTDAEATACLKHWAAMTERHRGLTFAQPARPRELVRDAVEENTGEPFTFTEVLPTAADFVADLHPADVPPETRGLMEVCLVLLNANEFVYLD